MGAESRLAHRLALQQGLKAPDKDIRPMKTCRLFLLPLLCIAVRANAQPAANQPALLYSQTAVSLAEQLLEQKASPTADDVTKFEADNGFSDSTALKSAFEKTLAMGQRIVGDGVKPGFAAFDQALRENLGVASNTKAGVAVAAAPAADKAKSSDGSTSAKDATQAPADPNAPLLTGLQALRGASQTQVLFLAHVYRIPPPGYEKISSQEFGGQEASLKGKWDSGIELLQNGLELDEIATAANPPKHPKVTDPAAVAKAATDATKAAVAKYRDIIPAGTLSDKDPFPDSFTDLVTAHGKALIAATAAKADQAKATAADAQKQSTSASNQASAAKTGTTAAASPAPASGSGSKTTPVIDPGTGKLADTVLRNIGISFGAGVGVAIGASSSSVLEVGLLRWNMIQEQATIRWNDKQSVAGQGALRVGYGFTGIQGTKLMEDEFGYTADTNAIEDIFWRSEWYPTSFGPFFGTAMPGNYSTFGHNSSGTLIKERPYLTGVQIGWLFYDEASSLLYLDIGSTISPNSGFRYAKPYIGVSADGLVLLKLIDGVRSFVPGGSSGSGTSGKSGSGSN
jgi:hypothetical protein